jgi:hypothetical protein
LSGPELPIRAQAIVVLSQRLRIQGQTQWAHVGGRLRGANLCCLGSRVETFVHFNE